MTGVEEAALLALWRVGATDRMSAVPRSYVRFDAHENTLFALCARGLAETDRDKGRHRVWWLSEEGWTEGCVLAAASGDVSRASAERATIRATRERVT